LAFVCNGRANALHGPGKKVLLMKRGRFVSSLAALCAARLPVAALAATVAPTPIHAAAAIDDSAVPFIYGMQSGLFRRYGLDASMERATSGAAIVAGVAGGAFEIGKSSITSLCAAHARGLPLVWIAPGGETDSSQQLIGLIVRADSPIKTGADLNGKIVGVSALNDYFSLAARTWIDVHGGDSSTIKLLEIPLSQQSGAVDTGRIDAAVLIQPFLQMALTGGKVRVAGDPSSAIGTHFLQVAWFTSTDFAAKNPAIVERFTRAMREASAYANGHHAETAGLLAGYMPAGTAPPMTSVPLGIRFNPAQIQMLIDLQARYKMIPATFDVREVIAPSALRP
jgi:NitT/TauT family transport system substrate-binding protein